MKVTSRSKQVFLKKVSVVSLHSVILALETKVHNLLRYIMLWHNGGDSFVHVCWVAS